MERRLAVTSAGNMAELRDLTDADLDRHINAALHNVEQAQRYVSELENEQFRRHNTELDLGGFAVWTQGELI